MNKKRTGQLTFALEQSMNTPPPPQAQNLGETYERNGPETCAKGAGSIADMPGPLSRSQSRSRGTATAQKRSPGSSRSKRKSPRRTLPKTRRPTDAELLVLAHSLGKRDCALLEYLYLIRYATTDQIYRVFFAGEPEGKARQDCRRRLWELGAKGVIAALAFEQRSRVWFIDKEGGLRILEDRLAVPKSERLASDKWRAPSRHLDHYVAITELYTQLLLSGLPHQWDSRPRLLSQYYAPNSSDVAPQYIRPDATIRLRVGEMVNGQWTPTGWWTIFLEADMGTERPEVLLDKLDRYQEAMKLTVQGIPEGESMGLAPRQNRYVLFACKTASRCQWLQEELDARWLPGLAVPMSEGLEKLRRIGRLTDKRLADLYRRRQEKSERERVRREQQAAWDHHDAVLKRWRAAGEQYVAQHRSLLKSAARLWGEYRRAHPEPNPPAFPRPTR